MYDITELSKEGKRKTGSLVACIKKIYLEYI